MNSRRTFVTSLASLSAAPLFAQTSEFVIGVADAVSYRANLESDAFFERLSKDVSKIVKRKVRVEKIPSYRILAEGLAQADRWDLVYVHPGHHAIRALRAGEHSLVALSKSHLNYRVSFLARSDSPIQKFEDVSGKRLLMPDADSITSWMTRAALKENTTVSARMPTLSTTRYQEAIRLAVENRLVDVGATASAADIKEWQAEGHKVLRSPGRAVPVKHWLLHKRHGQDLEKLREHLAALGEVGALGAKEGFVGFDESVLLELWKWLEQGRP